MSAREIVSREALRQISSITSEIKRQVGLLVTRGGDVAYVIIGDDKRISIPDLVPEQTEMSGPHLAEILELGRENHFDDRRVFEIGQVCRP